MTVLLLCAGCALLFTLKIVLGWRRDWMKNYPPGSPGLPLIGNLLEVGRLLRKTRFHWGVWRELAVRYGPVVQVRLGLAKPLLVVSGRKAILDFLGRRDFDGRPDTFEIRHRCFGKKRGIVLNDGQAWADQKRFLLKVFKDFGFGKHSMEDLILEDTEILCNVLRDSMLDTKIDVHDFCEATAIAVIGGLWTFVAGRRCDESEKKLEMLEILRILKESFRNGSAVGALWQHIPFLRFIMPKYSGFADQEKRVSAMSNYFLAEVARHKRNKKEGESHDLIDMYLDEIASRKGESSFDELQLVVLLKDLFSAGVDTTSNAIGFVILYLAKHPEKQLKVHEELDHVIGSHGIPKLSYKHSLPYLNATIAEVLRLANIAPTTIAHRAVVDCSLLGYDVKKNWTIIGNLHSVHMDPDHWVDSGTFRPERFIDAHGKFVEDPWLMPFGSGRRKCLGENTARMNLFLFLASLLQQFRFDLAPGETAPCLLGLNGFTISPPHTNIVITSRYHDKT